MRTATPATPTAKNNRKYNNCTLECIVLSTCTELSLKRPLLRLIYTCEVSGEGDGAET